TATAANDRAAGRRRALGACPHRARGRLARDARRRRLGARAAVPADAPAPARPGLLVARQRAAALRRARRRRLPARRREAARRGPRPMMPRAEMVHWWFAGGFLMLALLLFAELVVGPDVWALRPWRRYLWPGLTFLMGV